MQKNTRWRKSAQRSPYYWLSAFRRISGDSSAGSVWRMLGWKLQILHKRTFELRISLPSLFNLSVLQSNGLEKKMVERTSSEFIFTLENLQPFCTNTMIISDNYGIQSAFSLFNKCSSSWEDYVKNISLHKLMYSSFSLLSKSLTYIVFLGAGWPPKYVKYI